jgi:hypothetical protein
MSRAASRSLAPASPRTQTPALPGRGAPAAAAPAVSRLATHRSRDPGGGRRVPARTRGPPRERPRGSRGASRPALARHATSHRARGSAAPRHGGGAPPLPGTRRTRRVPSVVLSGHAASLFQPGARRRARRPPPHPRRGAKGATLECSSPRISSTISTIPGARGRPVGTGAWTRRVRLVRGVGRGVSV